MSGEGAPSVGPVPVPKSEKQLRKEKEKLAKKEKFLKKQEAAKNAQKIDSDKSSDKAKKGKTKTVGQEYVYTHLVGGKKGMKIRNHAK
jgi:hypothetical protein